MRLGLIFLAILAVAACSSKRRGEVRSVVISDVAASVQKTDLSSKASSDAPEFPVHKDFVPNVVDVTCAAGVDCPPQIGILLWALSDEKLDDGRIKTNTKHCVASLVGADLILSNSHCTSAGHLGFFILGAGKTRKIIRVKETLYASQLPPIDKTGHMADFAQDVALFRLKDRIELPKYLTLAQGPQLPFKQLTAYVADGGQQGDDLMVHYVIQPLTCNVRYDGLHFPFKIEQTPDVIRAFDCKIVAGNSGAPAFAEGAPQIQAVVQGMTSSEDFANEIRGLLGREPYADEIPDAGSFTNLRCVDLPGLQAQKCTTVNNDSIQKNLVVEAR